MTNPDRTNSSQEVGTELISILPPHFQLLSAHTNWRRNWSHIVAGEFSTSPHSGLLFYAQGEGVGEFYETNGSGQIALLQSHAGWRTSWTHIVPGVFRNPPRSSGLLLYDQHAGFGAFYDTDGQGNLIPLSEHSGWRDTWTHIVTGHFTDSQFSDLLFYDQSNAFGALYTTNGSGGMTLLAEYSNWRTSWTHIFIRRLRTKGGVSYPGGETKPVEVEGRHDIFFYEGSSGYSEIYEVDDHGVINLIGAQSLNPNATIIIPGSFGAPFTSLLMYDRNAGRGTVVDFTETGQITPNNKIVMSEGEKHEGWRTTWDIIVPGNFWVADEGDHHFSEGGFTDLLFYDRETGLGEFYLHEPPNSTEVRPLAGYVSAGSVRPGESIDFFVSSQVGPYSIKIYRQSADEVFMANISDLPAAPTPLPIGRTAWRDGAQWPAVGRLQIPRDWPSGLYIARVEASSAPPLNIPFIVRAAVDGSQSRILVVMKRHDV